MALREHSRPVAAGRTGRHGRPRPFGGRLRLPTIRFSGAAMAMSTVVGISLATTWLLNEQQQIGRRPGVTVGGPPVPSPDASSPTAEATPVDQPTGEQTAPPPSPRGSAASSPVPGPARTGARPAAATGPAGPSAPVNVPEATATRPSPSIPGTPSPSPSDTNSPLNPGEPSATPSPAPSPDPAQTLSGTARVDALGRAGTRHVVQVRLDETMTALQVEFRLARPAALPGTVPATDLPGAVATIALERDTLVYRFTTPSHLPLAPGVYTFTVTGALAAPTPTTPETWTASAFALPTSRAVAARGTF
ncbi:hypothetical protein [Kitasatospora sp. NPDC059673]|uniref:hypothetical protein n=1 Tax=Kitasatospora sp. NPDC059673 TaxID=3346901 RepID=UPI0036794258